MHEAMYTESPKRQPPIIVQVWIKVVEVRKEADGAFKVACSMKVRPCLTVNNTIIVLVVWQLPSVQHSIKSGQNTVEPLSLLATRGRDICTGEDVFTIIHHVI